MQTDTIEKNVEFSDAIRSIEDIKASYPDEWIVLGDPEIDEYDRTIAGVVLYHSPDKRELAYRDKPLMKKYQTKELFFNRVTPRREKRHAIISLYSTLKL